MYTNKIRWKGMVCGLLASIALGAALTVHGAVRQGPGAGYVAFEAETSATIIQGTPTTWEVRSDALASGGAALYAAGPNDVNLAPHSFVQYQIQFATPGTYYLYYRWYADPTRTAGDVFTANSIWAPMMFGAFDTPGEAGRSPFVNSASNSTQAPANNTLAWQREPETVILEVTAEDVAAGLPLILTVGTREAGMFVDRWVLSTDSSLNAAALDALANSETDLIPQGSGETFVAFEAETKGKIVPGSPTTWEVRTDSQSSGGAALYAAGPNDVNLAPHSFVQYQLQFATAGTYYLYYRWYADPARTAGDVFTANSIWAPMMFGAFDTPGEAGRSPFVNSASNSTQAPANNTLAWQREPETVILEVTEADVAAGLPLILTAGTREAGMFVDRWVLSTDPNLSAAALDALPNSGTQPPAPEPTRAVGSEALNTVRVTFTRPLAANSVQAGDFAVAPALSVTSATVDSEDARIVHLETGAQIQGTQYTITVNNINDTSGTAVPANSTVRFSAWKEVTGWVKREIYFGIPGSAVADLQAAPRFPGDPNRVEWIRSFDMENDPLTTDYGVRVSAFFIPPTTVEYEIFNRNDDEADFYLSSDATEANLQWLGVAPLNPNFEEWSYFDSWVPLTAGERHLLQVLLKQGAGDVYLGVRIRPRGSTADPRSLPPLGGAQVASFVNPDLGVVTFDQQPANASVTAGGRARFEARATTLATPVYYQWRVNGVDIPGATRPVFTTPVLGTADSGKRYSLVVSVAGTDTVSNEATVTVTAGDPPSVQPYIGINFVGGGGGGLGASLSAVDVAGVVPQENWNNLAGASFTEAPLQTAAGAESPVTLTATLTETWYSGTLATGSADGALLQGFLSAGSSLEPQTFLLSNVPDDSYQVLVYSTGFDFSADYQQVFELAGQTQYPTYYGKALTGLPYTLDPRYRRMDSTQAGTRPDGNYVQFDNVRPAGDGSLTLSVTWDSQAAGNTHQPAVNAIQLARVTPVTARPAISIARTGGTLTISWTGSAAGSTLLSSDTVGAGANWSAVAGAPNPISGAGSFEVNTGGATRYYQLRRSN